MAIYVAGVSPRPSTWPGISTAIYYVAGQPIRERTAASDQGVARDTGDGMPLRGIRPGD